MNANNYISGVCNIGKEERNRRKQAGIFGLVLTVIVYTLFLYFDSIRGVRFLIFIPAAMSASGFLQSVMHFCVHFGFSRIFNFESLGKYTKVEDKEFIQKDKKKAILILFYSVLIGIVAGLLAVIV
jgi:hypothetical protein